MRRIAVLTLTIALASCVPWTVRPLEDTEKQEDSTTSLARTPAAYVDSIWKSRLLPAIMDSAVDARVLLDALKADPAGARERYGKRDANGPVYFVLKGDGLVTAVDQSSRVGLALLDIAPFDRRPDISIQIGPVIRGTSLRDAPGIVRFSDFVNQLQFADAGNELNDRVLRTVLAPLNAKQLKGRILSFAGTVSAADNTDIPLPEVVPVRLQVENSR